MSMSEAERARRLLRGARVLHQGSPESVIAGHRVCTYCGVPLLGLTAGALYTTTTTTRFSRDYLLRLDAYVPCISE